MENSASYLLLEEMLIHGQLEIVVAEFEQFIEFLRHQELITAVEQQSLLDLAQRMNVEGGA